MNRIILPALVLVAAAAALLASSMLFTVHQTQQAIVTQFGEPKEIIRDPGLKFKLPFPIQEVAFLDKRVLNLDATRPEEIIASDQRRLVVDSFVRFRIVDPLKFYQTMGNERVARERLAVVLNASLRRVLGNVDSSAIVSGERSALMRQIGDVLGTESERFGIKIVDVRIKRADFPETISQAIFRRMQTEREREAREIRAQGVELAERIRADAERQRTVLLADARKQAEILRGDGDGLRTKIFADAANKDPEFYAFYRSMQAYSIALQQSDTSMVLSPDSEFFRYFGSKGGKFPGAVPGR
jgi:modulator of FtsH protease HflC